MTINFISAIAAELNAKSAAKTASDTMRAASIYVRAMSDAHGDSGVTGLAGRLSAAAADMTAAAAAIATALNDARGAVAVQVDGVSFPVEMAKDGKVKPASKHAPVRRLTDVAARLKAAAEFGDVGAFEALYKVEADEAPLRGENDADKAIAARREELRVAALSPVRRLLDAQEKAEAAEAAALEAVAEARKEFKAIVAAARKARADKLAAMEAVSAMESAAGNVAAVKADAAAEVSAARQAAEAAEAARLAAEAARTAESRARKEAQEARAKAEAELLSVQAATAKPTKVKAAK